MGADVLVAGPGRRPSVTFTDTGHWVALAGQVRCRSCGRQMDSHWVNGRAGYRCRHGHNSARTRPADAARNIYVREDVLLVWLATHFAGDRHRPGGDVESSTAEEAVARLRAQSTVIVCGRAD